MLSCLSLMIMMMLLMMMMMMIRAAGHAFDGFRGVLSSGLLFIAEMKVGRKLYELTDRP